MVNPMAATQAALIDGVSLKNPDVTPDAVSVEWLDGMLLGYKIVPSDGISDGSSYGTWVGTTDGGHSAFLMFSLMAATTADPDGVPDGTSAGGTPDTVSLGLLDGR